MLDRYQPVSIGEGKRGEDNRSILGEWLGMTADECAGLEARGVIQFSAEDPPPLG